MAHNVLQGLRHIATSATFPVSVAKLMAAIKWEAV